MAIKLQRECKGISAEYWKILKMEYSAVNGKTVVNLALYVSQETRNSGINNWLDSTSFIFEGSLSLAEAYVAIKASQLDVNGIESNPFINAIDC
jgi:hypothetical protein